MERDRGIKIIAIIALLVAIVGLGVGFAAYSTTLTISGTATVNSASWDVVFDNLGAVSLAGSATEATAPTINTNDTTLSDYAVTVTLPGDSVTYTLDVVNNGTINAKVTSISVPTPTCTGTGANAVTDAANVCSHLTYALTYANDTPVAVDDTLNASQTKNLKLVLSYASDIPPGELPEANVTISNLDITLMYGQQ